MGYERLHQALTVNAETMLRQWDDAFRDSRLRLPRRDNDHTLTNVASSLVEGLALAVPAPGEPQAPLAPGSPALRELEKAVAFAGASMAASGMSGYDAAAAILALRQVVRHALENGQSSEMNELFEWLVVLAMDSFSSAKVMGAKEKMQEQVERGTPVVTVVPEVPAALLFGNPDVTALDAILGRLVLLIVRVGAKTAILDASNLEDRASEAVMAALRRFLGHRKVSGAVTVAVIGLDGEERVAWRSAATRSGVEIEFPARFEDAVQRGLERAGARLVPAR